MAFVPEYILLLGFAGGVDYVAGVLLGRTSSPASRRWVLGIALGANLSVLVLFKYYNFLAQTVIDVAGLGGVALSAPALQLALPIGLSFHTFQGMSYVIEVFLRKQEPERHLGIFSVYVMFFPQLVAGPIERPQSLLPQFREAHRFNLQDAVVGSRLMLVGFVKKVVVADRLAILVDRVYADPHAYAAPVLALATVCFAFQIYCDFSGYTDIARGAAQMVEFWRRWHISLSTWLRDFVYIPFGGNRSGFARTQTNLLLTFMISGLWHGANWTFVVWGLLNGLYVVVENRLGHRRVLPSPDRTSSSNRARSVVSVAMVFFLSCVAWTFFRASSLGDAWFVLSEIASNPTELVDVRVIADAFAMVGMSQRSIVLCVLLCVGTFLFDAVVEHRIDAKRFTEWPRWLRWSTYYASLAMLLLLGKYGEEQFIYFQF